MATKYIQIGYHLPYNANTSLDSISVDGNPITEVKCIMSESNISDSGELISVLVGDPNFGTDAQTWTQTSEFDGGSGLGDSEVLNEQKKSAMGEYATITQTDSSITAWKWLNAKVEVDDSVTNLEQDIKDNYTIDGNGVLSFNVTGVTVSNSHITDGTTADFQIVT